MIAISSLLCPACEHLRYLCRDMLLSMNNPVESGQMNSPKAIYLMPDYNKIKWGCASLPALPSLSSLGKSNDRKNGFCHWPFLSFKWKCFCFFQICFY